jgi:acyl-CoA dehydrogenase
VHGFIAELKQIADQVRHSNLGGFGATSNRLDSAITDLGEATDWLLAQVRDAKVAEALAGATPYQRLFGLVLTGCYLAKGGLAQAPAGGAEGRIALCRFAAENLLSEVTALKDSVINGAASLAAAKIVLA